MYFLFDIGGTHMRLAASRDGETIDSSLSLVTSKNFEEAMSQIESHLEEIIGSEKVIGAAGGIAGILDTGKAWLFHSPNLREWEKKPLKATLEKLLNAPCTLENDAVMAGLGEATAGAGRDSQIVAYITVGTGVGGVRIVSEKVDERAVAFEPGHQIIDLKEKGELVELEALVSGAGIEKRMGKRPDEIKDAEFWDSVAKSLAIGLHNTILHWSPNIVVLGGGMIHANIIPLDLVTSHLQAIFTAFPVIPPLQKATLGEQSALLGALHMIKNP